ncbi:MAG: HlyD family secretion protein [Verrucomicrobiota bacterium]|nr:HlyD family secretion protein [Verrucomicrobiota bacterium]
MKRAGICALILMIALAGVCAQDLPTSPEPGSFEIEPPLLPGNLTPDAVPKSPANVDDLVRKLSRAKQSAASGERLFKMGAIAKVEAENRALRVIRLTNELAQARVAAAEDAKKAQGENASDKDLAEAKRVAELASAQQRQAELDAAALNLERQRKLFAVGAAGKSAVHRAEEKLAQLKNATP